MIKYILLISSMTLAVLGQIFFKKGIASSALSPNILSILQTIFTPYVFFGFFIYGLSSIVWLFVLQRFPLSVAYPSLALTYIIVAVLSTFIFKESLNFEKIIGILLIFIGVYFINK